MSTLGKSIELFTTVRRTIVREHISNRRWCLKTPVFFALQLLIFFSAAFVYLPGLPSCQADTYLIQYSFFLIFFSAAFVYLPGLPSCQADTYLIQYSFFLIFFSAAFVYLPGLPSCQADTYLIQYSFLPQSNMPVFSGILWYLLVSSGMLWYPLVSSGILWYPLVSSGILL
jgi:hypothetical protein